MDIENNIKAFTNSLAKTDCRLVAVSKTKPIGLIMEAYEAGQRIFGENKVQELVDKAGELPQDIEWHMIGHLQRNKVKYIASFVSLIHAVDSLKLLKEINKQAEKANRVINCLCQVHIAEEDTKFGLSEEELDHMLHTEEVAAMKFVKITGLMGMATFTEDQFQVTKEFKGLKKIFDRYSTADLPAHICMEELSMGMSGDYELAIQEGSTLIRVGSAIFGARD